MCTVTYVPQGADHFILTSNRDENKLRSPQNITTIVQSGIQLTFPRDTAAGGTWIAVSNTNRLVCLLNGAFHRHERRLTYKKSRGIMVLEFFDFANASAFFEEYNFDGMEPFTMIIFDDGDLYEFRWDEQQKHIQHLDKEQHYIWSSATLYEAEVIAKREQWHRDWLKEKSNPALKEIMDFHQNAGEGDAWNDVIMNRNGLVQTVSITNIIKQKYTIDMRYHDLLNQQLKTAQILLKREVVESI